MKPYKCFPYSYGDEGGSIKISKLSKKSKSTLIGLAVIVSVCVVPTLAKAADAELILINIQKAINELDGTATVSRRISPVGATACIISGICMSNAKAALTLGNVPVAAAFTCGAAIALCGDRVAANYGL